MLIYYIQYLEQISLDNRGGWKSQRAEHGAWARQPAAGLRTRPTRGQTRAADGAEGNLLQAKRVVEHPPPRPRPRRLPGVVVDHQDGLKLVFGFVFVFCHRWSGSFATSYV